MAVALLLDSHVESLAITVADFRLRHSNISVDEPTSQLCRKSPNEFQSPTQYLGQNKFIIR